MSKSNTFETDFLKLIFNATTIVGLARDDASPLTQLWLSLHTGDPGEAGDQTTSETGYPGYTRIAVTRNVAGFVITGNSVSPAANIDFPASTAVSADVTWAAIGTSPAGAGKVLYRGLLTPTIQILDGTVPRLTPASTITED